MLTGSRPLLVLREGGGYASVRRDVWFDIHGSLGRHQQAGHPAKLKLSESLATILGGLIVRLDETHYGFDADPCEFET